MNIRTLIARCAHVPSRNHAAKTQSRLRIRSPARGAGRRGVAIAGWQVGARDFSHWWREEFVLSTPGAGVSGTYRGGVAAHCLDEGPNRLFDEEGSRRGAARLVAGRNRVPPGDGRSHAWPAEAALRFAGTTRQ